MRIEKTVEFIDMPHDAQQECSQEAHNYSYIRVYLKGHNDYYPKTIKWLLENGACLEDKSVLVLISW